MARYYLTVSIPYVNARPHLGYALELVQADVLARSRRLAGDEVRFLGGTDDHALKNVLAAAAEGVPTQQLVDRNAAAFEGLRAPLGVTFDDFIRTSRDRRHAPGVERLWRQSAARGDFYRRWYEGHYCVGCEQFYAASDLLDGRCPEHGTPAEWVAEQNWFFRLSRYQEALERLLESGELAVVPEVFRNEALAFVRSGLEDISVSRSVERARGWGLPVPDDAGQVVYVWWDALANYVTALDFAANGDAYRHWWLEADERVHVIGKGILRFHAVYWPALLLSAGEPVPTKILVHPYLTVNGNKLSKSTGNVVDPRAVVGCHGTDRLRWWFVRDVPRTADADFTEERLQVRADNELADGIGNVVNRVAGLVHRLRDGRVPSVGSVLPRLDDVAPRVGVALDEFDFRGATTAIVEAVSTLNREIETTRPWELDRSSNLLDPTLGTLVASARHLVELTVPFIPGAAAALLHQLGRDSITLPQPRPIFPKSRDYANVIRP